MNVLVMSDYGISDTSTLKDVDLEDFLDEDDYQYLIYATGYAKITPYALIFPICISVNNWRCPSRFMEFLRRLNFKIFTFLPLP